MIVRCWDSFSHPKTIHRQSETIGRHLFHMDRSTRLWCNREEKHRSSDGSGSTREGDEICAACVRCLQSCSSLISVIVSLMNIDSSCSTQTENSSNLFLSSICPDEVSRILSSKMDTGAFLQPLRRPVASLSLFLIIKVMCLSKGTNCIWCSTVSAKTKNIAHSSCEKWCRSVIMIQPKQDCLWTLVSDSSSSSSSLHRRHVLHGWKTNDNINHCTLISSEEQRQTSKVRGPLYVRFILHRKKRLYTRGALGKRSVKSWLEIIGTVAVMNLSWETTRAVQPAEKAIVANGRQARERETYQGSVALKPPGTRAPWWYPTWVAGIPAKTFGLKWAWCAWAPQLWPKGPKLFMVIAKIELEYQRTFTLSYLPFYLRDNREKCAFVSLMHNEYSSSVFIPSSSYSRGYRSTEIKCLTSSAYLAVYWWLLFHAWVGRIEWIIVIQVECKSQA